MSKAQKGKLRLSKLGRKLSEGHKLKIKQNAPASKRVFVYEAVCVQFRTRKQKSIYQKGKFLMEYNSIQEAARQLGIKGQRIHQILSGKRPQAKGYMFQYG